MRSLAITRVVLVGCGTRLRAICPAMRLPRLVSQGEGSADPGISSLGAKEGARLGVSERDARSIRVDISANPIITVTAAASSIVPSQSQDSDGGQRLAVRPRSFRAPSGSIA